MLRTITLMLLVLTLAGCTFSYTDHQDIPVQRYDDARDNQRLLEEVLRYDTTYLAWKIPDLAEVPPNAIRISSFVSSSDDAANYRVTYDLTDDFVKENLDSFRVQFETVINGIIDTHIAKTDDFSELAGVGEAWFTGFASGDLEALYASADPILRDSVTLEGLRQYRRQMLEDYGDILLMSFTNAQFYEAFNGLPKSYSLFYIANVRNGQRLTVRVSFRDGDTERTVIGFGYSEQTG